MQINQFSEFVIYGAGEVGARCYEALKNNGYSVVAALDKNYCGNDIIEGLMVYRLGEEPKEVFEKSLIVICIADGMLHRDIANDLYARGYEWIVFLPMQYCINDTEKRKITVLYNNIIQGVEMPCDDEICSYKKYCLNDISPSNSVIRTTADGYIVWCPIEILFSESIELWKGDLSKIRDKTEAKDKPLLYGNAIESLFLYFRNEESSSDRYFDSFYILDTPKTRQESLLRRERLFRIFKSELNRGMNFFIEAAPPTIWNPKNYFNLIGGHHRTTFLQAEGHTLLPIHVTKEDFQKWCNETVYDRFTDYIVKHDISMFYAPIPHPGLINYPVKTEYCGRTKLEAIMSFCKPHNVLKMSVLDCSYDQGYYARSFKRLGVTDIMVKTESREESEFVDLVNELLYLSDIPTDNGTIDGLNRKYDIILCLNGVMNKAADFVRLTKITNKFLFCEVDCVDIFEEITTKESIFDYQILYNEHRDGKRWYIGVLIKNG